MKEKITSVVGVDFQFDQLPVKPCDFDGLRDFLPRCSPREQGFMVALWEASPNFLSAMEAFSASYSNSGINSRKKKLSRVRSFIYSLRKESKDETSFRIYSLDGRSKYLLDVPRKNGSIVIPHEAREWASKIPDHRAFNLALKCNQLVVDGFELKAGHSNVELRFINSLIENFGDRISYPRLKSSIWGRNGQSYENAYLMVIKKQVVNKWEKFGVEASIKNIPSLGYKLILK